MTDILKDLTSRCRAILGKDSGPAGRDEVAALLSEMLQSAEVHGRQVLGRRRTGRG